MNSTKGKRTVRILSICLLSGATLLSSQLSYAGTSGNIGVTNNYIWRGVTQSDDKAAVSGGLDYSMDSGFYAGTWLSNIDFGSTEQGTELDVYGGYAKELSSGLSFDVGAIRYMYPGSEVPSSYNFNEVYGKLGFKGAELEVAHDPDNDNTYYAVSYGGDIKEGLGYGVKVGQYDFDDGSEYTHYQVSLSKDDFTFAVDDNDMEGSVGDPKVSVAYSKSFDF